MTSRRTLSAALAVLALSAPPAAADVVVELFTSQGCSSCPPADDLMGELAARDDVIALSFHVDYWDYLGWRDTFARPEHTARQISYRDAWKERVIYTPQAVVQGRGSVTATSRGKLMSAIAAAAGSGPDHMIRIGSEDGMLKARLQPVPIERPCTIWIAKYDREETVEVARGENAGRTLTYNNIVTGLDRIGEWDGSAPETVMLPQPAPGEGVAVWLQDGPGGPILAAADYRP